MLDFVKKLFCCKHKETESLYTYYQFHDDYICVKVDVLCKKCGKFINSHTVTRKIANAKGK